MGIRNKKCKCFVYLNLVWDWLNVRQEQTVHRNKVMQNEKTSEKNQKTNKYKKIQNKKYNQIDKENV